MRYGRDKWLAPIEVASGANVIKVRAGTSGAWQDATITLGLAYPFYDDTYTALNSLYGRARTALLAALGSGTLLLSADAAFNDLDCGAQRLLELQRGGRRKEMDTCGRMQEDVEGETTEWEWSQTQA